MFRLQANISIFFRDMALTHMFDLKMTEKKFNFGGSITFQKLITIPNNKSLVRCLWVSSPILYRCATEKDNKN